MAWAQHDFAIEHNAIDQVRVLLRSNHIRLADVNVENLIELVREYRDVYAQFYHNGSGLMRDGRKMGLGEIEDFVTDPADLKSRLANPEGGAYSDIEQAFLISAKVLCKSEIAARTLGTLPTKRTRDKIAHRIQSIKWV